MEEVPIIDGYNQDLCVWFDVNRASHDISKDLIILLQSSSFTTGTALIDEAFEQVLIKNIESVQKTKKTHALSQVLESNDQSIHIRIQLNYQEVVEEKEKEEKEEEEEEEEEERNDEKVTDAIQANEAYIEIIGNVRSICINRSGNQLNTAKHKYQTAIHESVQQLEQKEQEQGGGGGRSTELSKSK